MVLLLQELFSLEQDFTPDAERQRRGIELILDHPEYGCFLLLKRDAEILGMVNLLMTVSTALGDRVILLEDFIIKRNERGKGRGRFFIEVIKDWARREGFARITLLADKNNLPAREFYRAMDFEASNMDCWRYILK